MNNEKEIALAGFTGRSKTLINNVKELLSKTDIPTVNLPETIYDKEKPISLVLAGQYSAGKSTILKALTGIEDIAIGEGITTQETCEYDWNGIIVVDTPGIHTQLRPDHDDISYNAITNADLLVYVVTNHLFDNYIGQNFRKILLDKEKAAEMILVVNKMADEGNGNTEEMHQIKSNALREVTTPFSPEELRTCFIDAESYCDSIVESDIELKEALQVRSNFDYFKDTLNGFIRDKGISARLTTALYQTYATLEKAIIHLQPSSGDIDVDALEERLLQERRILFNTQHRIEQNIKSIVHEAAYSIREKGRTIANTIYESKSEDEANIAIEGLYNEVNKISETCSENIITEIERLSSDCVTELDDFYKSDFYVKLEMHLSERKDNPFLTSIDQSKILSKGYQQIVTNSIGNAGKTGLQMYSGSKVHDVVLKVGHFFGHKFKPWEAVKYTKGISAAGKALGVLGVIFSLGMQIKDDIDSDARQQEMRSNRENIRAGCSSAANALVEHFSKSLRDYLAKTYILDIAKLDKQISEIRQCRIGKTKICELIETAQDECRFLISDIHSAEI